MNGLAGLYFLKMGAIAASAVLVARPGLMRTMIWLTYCPPQKMEGSISLYGSLLTILAATPITLYFLPKRLTTSPTGSLKPMTFAAVSFKIIALLSVT